MNKKKILLIDDESDSIEATKFILAEAGYEILVASSGEEGLAKFKTSSPDLVLLDILMPQIDGLEVLYMLRNVLPEGKSVPVIMLTAKEDLDIQLQAKGFGATEYVCKTANPQELLEKIEKALSPNI